MFKRFRDRRIDQSARISHREFFLKTDDFIMPLFVVNGTGIKKEIPSMKNVFHYSADMLLPDLGDLVAKGLSSVLIFGVPEHKGVEQSYAPDGLVHNSIALIKKHFPKLEIITDVCLCSYTEDGQCHIGDNDATCEILARVALSHARAGADIVAPSDMMDGRVHFIKNKLDANGLGNVPIMSYAAKFASNFYGPFRDAAECAPRSGDRKNYQMDIPNSNEAMEEIAADIEEGASEIIIKPALSYLDIIYRAKEKFGKPIVAYNVSGEYSMINMMIEKKLAHESIIYETIVSMKRAGADRIITYHTPYLLEHINDFRTI